MRKHQNKFAMLFVMAATLIASQFFTTTARAESSFFTSQGCSGCHSAPVVATCNGCHAHGTHASSSKSTINVTGTTNKTSYAPGETVTVTITGGYRSGWVRTVLYDQNNVELARSTGNASGMGSSTTYPATLTAPAPTAAGAYSWKVAWYGNQFDASGAKFGAGWTPDPNNPNHGEEIVAISSFTVTAPAGDAIAPTVTTFTLPATASSLTVPVTALTATDNTGVTGYLVTTSATAPAATAAGWSATAPTSVTAAAAGSVTFYAWAKDAAGNVSLGKSATVVITLVTADTTAPTVNTFTLPATASSLTVPVSALAASDNIGITGYLITMSAMAPSASAAGWSASVPTSVVAPAAGTVTFYAWAKDAAGNVSSAKSATVVITLATADVTAPTVDAFVLPTTASSLTVTVSSLAASDNTGVTGYLITTSSSTPGAMTAGWSSSAPATVTAPAAGTVTFYAWAKDAAGNVSSAKSATVTITLATGGDNPVLTVSTLDDGAVTNKATLNITGTATDPDGIKTVTLNEKKLKIMAGGSFTTSFRLKPGANTIKLTATDSTGAQSVDSRTITYDKQAPQMTISTPVDYLKTNESFITVNGTINETSTVKTSVNGGPHEFAAINGNNFSSTVYLKHGMNTIIFKATDLAGNSSSLKRTVFFDDGKPNLAVTSPAKDMMTKKQQLLLKGKVKGIDGDLSVSIEMDGTTYSPAVVKGKFVQPLTFPAAGEYDIVVTATDANGSSSVHRIVTYQPEVKADDDNDDDD